MKTPLETRGSRANDGKSARLGKKQPDGTHAHRIAHRPASPKLARWNVEPRTLGLGRAGGTGDVWCGKLTGQHPGQLPVGPQRHAGVSVRGQSHAQHLVQLDVVAVES